MTLPSSREMWARALSNEPVEVMVSGMYAATTSGNVNVNYGARGAVVQIVVSRHSGMSTTFGLWGTDSTGTYDWILISGAAVVSGVQVIRCYPELTAATNIGKDVLPRYWKVRAAHANAAQGRYHVTLFPLQ